MGQAQHGRGGCFSGVQPSRKGGGRGRTKKGEKPFEREPLKGSVTNPMKGRKHSWSRKRRPSNKRKKQKRKERHGRKRSPRPRGRPRPESNEMGGTAPSRAPAKCSARNHPHVKGGIVGQRDDQKKEKQNTTPGREDGERAVIKSKDIKKKAHAPILGDGKDRAGKKQTAEKKGPGTKLGGTTSFKGGRRLVIATKGQRPGMSNSLKRLRGS